MLACAKIGAVHSVVFGGFSVDSLQGRIEDSESKLVITADGSYNNGKVVELKRTVDEALKRCPSVENVIVIKRIGHEVPMEAGRDHWYHEMLALPIANGKCATEVMDAEDPLYILYTSGSTGKPKAILHTHGGYMVGTYSTLKYVFDINDEDRWWCAADPGWVTGHSYIVYGPLLNGATSFMFEGGPSYPYPNRWWQCVERYGITILYTAPTAIRGLMRFGEAWPNKHDLSSLRLLGIGRRADQPRGLEVVLPRHRQGTLSDHGHLVADRDRHVHDHAHAHGAAQTRLRHAPVLWAGGGHPGRARQAGPGRHGRLPGAEEPLARHAADDLRRPRPICQPVLVQISRASTQPATPPSATRTAISGSSVAWTT